MAVALNTLAADIHKRMCDDPGFGYSWSERWGATATKWTVDGVGITISKGDYDCSSSTITAWRLALKAAGYSNPLPSATYTGNMKSAFLATGLFKWVPVSQAQRGDLYLNEQNHVAMCQGSGRLSEFSSNEYGGAYGGKRGDQTGWESHITGYYSYPWDGCLHYIGTKTVPTSKEELEMTLAELKKYLASTDGKTAISRAVWGAKNAKLEKVDTYQILRDTRDDAEANRKALEKIAKKLDEIAAKL